MCIAVGLYVHRSFHRGGWSDGQHNTCRLSTPEGVWRQAPVNLNLLSCDSRLTHCSVVKEPGSSAHSTWLSTVGLKVTIASREWFPAGFGRERNCNQLDELIQFRTCSPFGDIPAPPQGGEESLCNQALRPSAPQSAMFLPKSISEGDRWTAGLEASRIRTSQPLTFLFIRMNSQRIAAIKRSAPIDSAATMWRATLSPHTIGGITMMIANTIIHVGHSL